MEIEELIEKYNKANTKEEWIELEKDMLKFLDEDHPKGEKRLLAPLGYLEIVSMTIETFEK